MVTRILAAIFAVFLLLVSGYLLVRGTELITLGGSWYYALSGAALTAVAILIVLRSKWSARIYAGILAATVIWSLAEAGLDLTALLPRLSAWIVVGLWFLTPLHAASMRPMATGRREGGAVWVAIAQTAGALLLSVGAMQGYPVNSGTNNHVSGVGRSDWPSYGGNVAGQRFAAIDQITGENVSTLKEAWRFRTGIPYEFKNTPLQVGELLYVCTAGNTIIAIDAATGAERWRMETNKAVPGGDGPEGLAKAGTYARTCRGVVYYEAPDSYAGECSKRIVTGTTSAQLVALDALTGARCRSFGVDGAVDLRKGMGQHSPGSYMVTSAPLLAKDKIVVGGFVSDSQQLGMPSGVVRAYDAVTGQFDWAWDAGNPLNHAEPGDGAEYTRGTPNVWSNMSYDAELDLVFAPTGNASPDYYGAKRREFDEQTSTATVALRGSSGDPAWIYQNTHHDIWDYDSGSQPVLLDVVKNGERIPALLQPTKRGEIFAIDRRTGAAVWPATVCDDGSTAQAGGECPVPQGPVKGDYVSATQPFSALPNFRPDRLERDMWGLTPLDQLYCRIEYNKMRYDGHFTPPEEGGGGGSSGKPTYGGAFQWPGYGGGFNWPSVAADPDNGLIVAAPMLMGNRLVMTSATGRQGRGGANASAPTGQGEWDPAAPRFGMTAPFMSDWTIPFTHIKTGMPCFEPPYGRLAVIDANTSKLLWSRPIGTMEDVGPFGIAPGLPFNVGTPVYGGLIATRGGLIFQVGTMDSNIRAVDIRTGKVKWKAKLPGSSHATPISYVSTRNGKQYIVICVPNPGVAYPRIEGAPPTDNKGGYVIAYALP